MFRKIFNILGIVFLLIPVGLFFLSVFIYLIFNLPNTIEQNKFSSRLESYLVLGKEEVILKDVMWFDWEKVCLFPPYSIVGNWEDYIGKNPKSQYVDTGDGVGNLIFISNGEVKDFYYYTSQFSNISQQISCSKSMMAKFVLKDESNLHQEKRDLIAERKKHKIGTKEYLKFSEKLNKFFCSSLQAKCIYLTD